MVGVVLAAAAAAVFGAGSSLQHRAASGVPRADVSTVGLVLCLLQRPAWRLGILLSGAAFGLHVAALRHGSLTLIQAIVVSNIIFAVIVRAALDRSPPPWREIVWAIGTCSGLSLFIAMLETHTAQHTGAPPQAAVFVVTCVVVTIVAVWCAEKTDVAARRGFLLASAAGSLYGLTAGLIKVVIIQATADGVAVLEHWSLWATILVGVNALVLSQRAYHAARLSITVPILNIADVLVAITFGNTVFRERVFSSPAHLVGGLGGLLVMGVGLWQLARLEERIRLQHHPSASVAETPAPSSSPREHSRGRTPS
jgi:hypothetical protein